LYDRSFDGQKNAAAILKAINLGAENNYNIELKLIDNVYEPSSTTFNYTDKQVVTLLLATYFY
jgi:hypothetical protein